MPAKYGYFCYNDSMQNLDKKAVWLFFFRSVFKVTLLAVFLGFWSRSWDLFGGAWRFADEGIGYMAPTPESIISKILLFLIIFLIISFAWSKLVYYFYKYQLTELGFKKESGVIYKRYVTIPYDRIQNVDIHRSLLARLLRLSDLRIQTAGATGATYAGAEGRLPGLSPSVAESLRDELVKRASESRTQGL